MAFWTVSSSQIFLDFSALRIACEEIVVMSQKAILRNLKNMKMSVQWSFLLSKESFDHVMILFRFISLGFWNVVEFCSDLFRLVFKRISKEVLNIIQKNSLKHYPEK
jgi:hypothetical protein